MATMASSTSYLQISGIFVDFSKPRKNIESAELRLCGVQKSFECDATTVKVLHETFDPPMKLSRGSSFSLCLTYKKKQFGKNKPEEINIDMEEAFLAYGKHEYHKSLNGITIVINLDWDTSNKRVGKSATSLTESLDANLTTDDLYKICPRFRILVIGKTGVGKSSLINHTSGTQKALVSHDKPGEANIDTEFISQQNDKFVLHDSKGFEPGEEDNAKVVREFIERRRHMDDLKDRLHAVWLCCEIPRAGGRLLEKGTEHLLSLKSGGELGNIPVVVVFTKYDMLIDRVDRILDESALEGLSDDEINKLIRQKADAELQEMCTKPFERFAGSDIPYAPVSKKEMHKGMITHLIQMTEDCVRRHVASEVSVMTSIAPRVDSNLKIKASLEVGKRSVLY